MQTCRRGLCDSVMAGGSNWLETEAALAGWQRSRVQATRRLSAVSTRSLSVMRTPTAWVTSAARLPVCPASLCCSKACNVHDSTRTCVLLKYPTGTRASRHTFWALCVSAYKAAKRVASLVHSLVPAQFSSIKRALKGGQHEGTAYVNGGQRRLSKRPIGFA